jgi:hypothetical protein
MPYDTHEDELEAERQNGDRLNAALTTALAMMRDDEREALNAVLVCPRASQLTVGHVLDGALALHQQVNDRRAV